MTVEASKKCANSTKEVKCGRDHVPGHIYCTSCRLQTGGYYRYNPAPLITHIHSYRSIYGISRK
jgi:uncharacterized OB-fold protein